MNLTAENVTKVFNDCLFTEEEVIKGIDMDTAVVVEGITSKFGLNPQRLTSHLQEVIDMLGELPKEFHEGTGDGMSFLGACVDRNETHWGEHKHIQELVVLGIGLKKVKYCLPRAVWSVLPGGVPYFVVVK